MTLVGVTMISTGTWLGFGFGFGTGFGTGFGFAMRSGTSCLVSCPCGISLTTW